MGAPSTRRLTLPIAVAVDVWPLATVSLGKGCGECVVVISESSLMTDVVAPVS